MLRHPLTLDQARETVRRQLADRGGAWLRSLERNVYGNPNSPYLPLLNRAQCELGDLRASVTNEGLEPTLNRLRDAGVYVSFEEFKGRQPIDRGDLVLEPRPEDFDNPHIRGGIPGSTGGTTGRAVPVGLTVHRIVDKAPARLLVQHAHQATNVRLAVWRGFPYGGLSHSLTDAAAGFPHERWFAPTRSIGPLTAAIGRMALAGVRAVARAAGTFVPAPKWTAQNDIARILRWAAHTTSDRTPFLITGVSQALRIAVASHEHGIDLSDLTVFASGEPPTPGKLTRIREAGIRLIPHYTITEAGHVAIPCASPSADTDMHVLTNLFAVTQHTRQLSGVGITVDPLSLTSLGSLPVKVLLNVETDDYGEISERNCGCPIDEAGLHVHLSDVYSFGKLTGEGVSLVGTHVQHILDDLLPRRFGGTGLDYQLVEEEDDRGYTRVVLVASPRVAAEDPELVEAFLEGLGSGGLAADVRSIWRQAGTMRVRRAEPIATSAGKVLPLVTTRLKPAERDRGGA